MISHASHSYDRFATTRWSVVMRMADMDSPRARNALGDLAQRYWYAVYAFARRCGQPPASAAMVTRTLLGRLVAETIPHVASRHYRSYLLDRVRTFRDSGWKINAAPPGASEPGPAGPPDIEARYLRDHAVASSPEQAFQRSFAIVVLHRTLRRMRQEAEQSGRSDMCRALEPYLSHDPGEGDFERLAAQLRSHKVTLIVGLKRLRQRLRELAAEELTDTVSSADDLASEQDALLAILGEMAA